MIYSGLLLLVMSQAHFSAKEVEALFLEGNQAYAQNDFETAASRFQKLVDHGHGSADVLFNLGTTYLSMNRLGEAVFALERAWRLQPADDIEAQLGFARSRMVDDAGQSAAASSAWHRHPAWSGLFLGALWLAFGAFTASRFIRATRRGFALFLGAAGLLIALCAGAAVAFHAWERRNLVEAIVIDDKAFVKPLPDENADSAFEIHAGLKVRVLEMQQGFSHLRLSNGVEGWVVTKALAVLPPS